jgi:DNA integrity scanning protein DisA with diadenylate cyclase activity
LGRLGILKVALLIGLSSGDLAADDKIVFLGGKASRQLLDTIMVIDLASESELITQSGIGTLSETVKPDIFEGVLKLAMELANSSREGKSIGTIFVLGDEDKVMQLSKQMIMNPFYGYPSQERQILNPQLKETIREFSSLDGAFIISDDGEVIAAGRYLGANTEETDVLRGLGSRHLAAAGITALTKAVSIVISQSSGDIRIFKNGKTVMEIERQL